MLLNPKLMIIQILSLHFITFFFSNLWENNIHLKVDLFLSDQSFEVLKRQKGLLCEQFTFSYNNCKF